MAQYSDSSASPKQLLDRLEHLPIALSVSSLSGEQRVLFSNSLFRRIFGVNPRETLPAGAAQACREAIGRAQPTEWHDGVSAHDNDGQWSRARPIRIAGEDGMTRDMLLSISISGDTLSAAYVDLDDRPDPPPLPVGANTPASVQTVARLREAERTSILRDMLRDAPLAALCERIVRTAEAEDPVSLCSILLLDEAGEHLHVLAAPSLPDFYNAAVEGLAVGEGSGSCGTAAATGKLVVAEDIARHPYWEPYRNLAARAGLRACWSHPVIAQDGQVLATFAIYYRTPRAPTAAEIERIETAADLAGLAIERARHRATLAYRTAFEQAVRDISAAFLSRSGAALDEAIQYAMERIGACAKANRCYLFLLSDDGRTMRCTHEWCAPGVAAQIDDLQDLDVEHYPWLTEIAHSGKTAKITEADLRLLSPEEKRVFREGSIRSMLAVPMFSSGDRGMKGLLGLDDVAALRRWGDFEWRLLRVATDIISSALARSALERRLVLEARQDPLTGIANRRSFTENLQIELERTGRTHKRSCLLLIDADHFKAINDRYGHDVGDRALQALVDVLARRIRRSDILARWGGEEFCLMLPDTDAEGAARLAEALRAAVEAAHFPGPERITVSLGGTCLQPDDTLQALFRRVDEALYEAKSRGRNCWVLR